MENENVNKAIYIDVIVSKQANTLIFSTCPFSLQPGTGIVIYTPQHSIPVACREIKPHL